MRFAAILTLAFASSSATAANVEKAALVWSLPWDADWVTSVSFLSPTRVAAGNNLGQILVWDLPDSYKAPTPSPVRRLDGHTNTITRLITTPDGRWLISSSYDHTIRLWDIQGNAVRKDAVVLNVRAIEEAQTRKRKEPPAKSVKVDVQETDKVLQGHNDWITSMSLSKDGTLLASGDEKGEVIIRQLPSGSEQRRWKVKGWVYAVALSPEKDALLVTERLPLVFDSGRHAGVKIWNPATGESKIDLGKSFDKQHLAAAVYSPDGKHLAVGRGGETDGLSGKATLLDPATGKVRKELTPAHLNGLTDLAFHPDSKTLFSCGRDTVVRCWDIEKGKQVKELGQPRGGQSKDWIHAVAVSPDGKLLAAADMAGQVHIWSLEGK
jgi:WD40 repeat protein